jgi:hypothetical protein
LVTRESVADAQNPRPVVNVAWANSVGALSPTQVLTAETLNVPALRSVFMPSGGLMLCPWNLSAPLGGALASQPGACNQDEVSPVRMKGVDTSFGPIPGGE